MLWVIKLVQLVPTNPSKPPKLEAMHFPKAASPWGKDLKGVDEQQTNSTHVCNYIYIYVSIYNCVYNVLYIM